jgi:hypothetical protein
MKKTIVALAFLAVAACGKKSSQQIKEFEGFKDKICKCTDAACGKAVYADWQKWRDAQKSPPPDSAKDKVKELSKQLNECASKLGVF